MQLNKMVDNLCLYDPDFKHVAERFVRDLGGSSDMYEVGCMDDLKNALTSFKGVKFLEVVLHGSMGTIHAGKTQMGAAHFGSMAKNNLNLLQKNAQILFDSCSVGKGNYGTQFMDRLGADMLSGKGGIIGASTIDNRPVRVFGHVIMDPLSLGGRLKVRKYDENGKLAKSLQVDRNGNRD